MNLRQEVSPRVALVVLLVLAYTVALVALISLARRETSLVKRTAATEALAAQTVGSVESLLPVLRAEVTRLKEQVATLEARVPGDGPSNVFEKVAQDAQVSGVTDFRYQRKTEFIETLQSGVFKVYRYTISGRGSQERIIAFLDGLQKDSGQTMIIENVIVSAVNQEWQLSADIIVYTWGG
jgi:hypothetical protein